MAIMVFVFLAVLLAGVPVFIALAGSSLIYTDFLAGIPDFVIHHRMAGGIDSFPLLAVPFFILAGNLMNSAGITNRIYDFAVALCGWMRGGLAHVNIIGSVIFAGMSGTAIADAAGVAPHPGQGARGDRDRAPVSRGGGAAPRPPTARPPPPP